MKYGRKGIVLVLAITFIALVLPISTVSSKPPRMLPFMEYATAKGTAAGTPPILEVDTSGSGLATYLGEFTLAQRHTVDLTTLTFYDGTYVDTAANGDMIFGTYYGYMVPLANGDLEIHGVFTITGGTGRLNDAVGGGSVIGIQHPDNTGWLLVLGTISF